LEFRESTIEEYPSVFKATGKQTASSGYGWFAIIDNLCNGNLLNFDKVTELPLNLCLNKLSLDADRAKERDKQRKKQRLNK
jgi:hypothetical protein